MPIFATFVEVCGFKQRFELHLLAAVYIPHMPCSRLYH